MGKSADMLRNEQGSPGAKALLVGPLVFDKEGMDLYHDGVEVICWQAVVQYWLASEEQAPFMLGVYSEPKPEGLHVQLVEEVFGEDEPELSASIYGNPRTVWEYAQDLLCENGYKGGDAIWVVLYDREGYVVPLRLAADDRANSR